MTSWVLALAAIGLFAVPPADGRDPFAPPERMPAPTPLERIELAELRLVALVYAPAPRALLEDASGAAHLAAVGTALGSRGARVMAIEPGRLRVREPGAEDVMLELAGDGAPAP